MLTEQERKVLDLTAELANAFWQLPEEHQDQAAEFTVLLHRIQDMVAARSVYRTLNQEACNGNDTN